MSNRGVMVSSARDVTVSITGDNWRPDMTRQFGPTENSHHIGGTPDLASMMKDYEYRHGRCSSFEIKIVK